MRRDRDFFHEQDVELVYIAKRLSEAQDLESLLTSANTDYLVEADHYLGGFLFQRVRVGAFFYVLAGAAEPARQLLEAHGYRPQRTAD
jgi:hypothetical protein